MTVSVEVADRVWSWECRLRDIGEFLGATFRELEDSRALGAADSVGAAWVAVITAQEDIHTMRRALQR